VSIPILPIEVRTGEGQRFLPIDLFLRIFYSKEGKPCGV